MKNLFYLILLFLITSCDEYNLVNVTKLKIDITKGMELDEGYFEIAEERLKEAIS